MSPCSVQLSSFPVAFRWRFSHASASRSQAENVILTLGTRTQAHYGEACPRPYVTGETQQSVAAFLSAQAAALSAKVGSLDDLRVWMETNRGLIDANPSAFGAIELALLDRLGHGQEQTFEALIGGAQRGGPFRYSAVIGAGGFVGFLAQALAYRTAGFFDVKLKLGRDPALNLDKAKWLRRLFGRRLRLRVDANNLWPDASTCIKELGALRPYIWAVEEPLKANDLAGCRAVSSSLDLKIILDESCCRIEQLDDLTREPDCWVINLRISKMGGILRSLEFAKAAAARNLPMIIGAHVGETSLLTRASLAVAACVPEAPLAMEGAFGTRLLKADLVTDPIMFARSGLLAPDVGSWRRRPGNGLSIQDRLLTPLRT